MYVSFTETKPDSTSVSLAYKLGIGPCARFRTMASGCKLTYEDNPEDVITVWVAEKRRDAIIEPTTKYKPVYGFKGVYS